MNEKALKVNLMCTIITIIPNMLCFAIILSIFRVFHINFYFPLLMTIN